MRKLIGGFGLMLMMLLGGPVCVGEEAKGEIISMEEIQPWLANAWRTYRNHFVTNEGRVVDDVNGSVSHSEGQGYAMLIAVRANDRDTFENLWSWTKANLFVREDNLPAWLWKPDGEERTPDTDDASDGNLLIAWALSEAASKWQVPRYMEESRTLARTAVEKNTVASRFGRILLPGSRAFGASDRPDGPVVNFSYWVFPSFLRLKNEVPEFDWNGLLETGIELIGISRFGPRKLPSDWIALSGDRPRPANYFKRVFGYDAVRIPLYLAWAIPEERHVLEHFAKALHRSENGSLSVVDIDTGAMTEEFNGVGYQAIMALLNCVLDETPVPEPLLRVSPESYYATTLHILSLLAINDVRPQCLRHR